MNHEVFEKEMIDGVNRHAEEQRKHSASTVTTKLSLFTKTDATTLKRGLKRMVIALFTAVLFAIAIFGFIVTAIATGYMAVMIFLTSVVILGCAFAFVYAQGITRWTLVESQGDDK